MGGSPLPPQTLSGGVGGVEGALLLLRLSALLLLWSFAGQLQAGVVLVRSKLTVNCVLIPPRQVCSLLLIAG